MNNKCSVTLIYLGLIRLYRSTVHTVNWETVVLCVIVLLAVITIILWYEK